MVLTLVVVVLSISHSLHVCTRASIDTGLLTGLLMFDEAGVLLLPEAGIDSTGLVVVVY